MVSTGVKKLLIHLHILIHNKVSAHSLYFVNQSNIFKSKNSNNKQIVFDNFFDNSPQYFLFSLFLKLRLVICLILWNSLYFSIFSSPLPVLLSALFIDV